MIAIIILHRTMNVLAFLSLLGTAMAAHGGVEGGACLSGGYMEFGDGCDSLSGGLDFHDSTKHTECGGDQCITLSYVIEMEGCTIGIAESECAGDSTETTDCSEWLEEAESQYDVDGVEFVGQTDCMICDRTAQTGSDDTCNPGYFTGDLRSPASSLRAAFVPRIIKTLLTTFRLL